MQESGGAKRGRVVPVGGEGTSASCHDGADRRRDWWMSMEGCGGAGRWDEDLRLAERCECLGLRGE